MNNAIKSSLILAAASAFAASAFGQDPLIVGTDFDNFEFGAFTENDDVLDFTSPNIPFLFSDVGASATMYWDGTNGSSAFANIGVGQGGGDNVGAGFGTDSVNQAIPSRADLSNPFFRQDFSTLTDASAVTFGNSGTGALVNGLSFSIVLDLSAFTDITMSFAAAAQTDAANSINWAYNIGGGNVNIAADAGDASSDGVTTIITDDTFRLYSLDLPAAVNGLSDVQIIGTLNGQTNDLDVTSIDNIQVTGVPEPSVYAAIFGVLALGFAIYRRRK